MSMQVNPLSDVLGAEVIGINVGNLDAATFDKVHDAFLEYHVLVFRDQDLSPERQVDFAQRFGELDVHIQKDNKHSGHEAMQILSNKKVNGEYIGSPSAGDAWHSDLSYTDIPTLCTMLYAMETPEVGGDTEWSNMYRAYDMLTEEMKQKLDGLHARHTFNRFRNHRVEVPEIYKGMGKERYADIAPPDAVHPLVRTHPETGRKALYLSERFTIGIEELEEDEGQALMDELITHQKQRDFIYRHKWNLHDLTIWDNRCLIHLACGGVPEGQIRHMHRVIVRGDKPY
jgi:taurine dioxygenase